MSKYLTAENISLLMVVLVYLFGIFKAIAAKTSNKTDDKIVESIDKYVTWGQEVAPHLWAMVEVASKFKNMTGEEKKNEFLKILKDKALEVHGKELGEGATSAAKLISEGLSAAEKLSNFPQALEEKKDV